MGIKVVPRKKKIKLTPTQKAVMGSYEHGGVVKKRRKLPSGVTAPPYIPPTTRGALGMSGAMGGALGIGSALGTAARDGRVYSNQRLLPPPSPVGRPLPRIPAKRFDAKRPDQRQLYRRGN